MTFTNISNNTLESMNVSYDGVNILIIQPLENKEIYMTLNDNIVVSLATDGTIIKNIINTHKYYNNKLMIYDKNIKIDGVSICYFVNSEKSNMPWSIDISGSYISSIISSSLYTKKGKDYTALSGISETDPANELCN